MAHLSFKTIRHYTPNKRKCKAPADFLYLSGKPFGCKRMERRVAFPDGASGREPVFAGLFGGSESYPVPGRATAGASTSKSGRLG